MDTASRATPDEIRSRLHGMWASVAPAWGEHADYLDERGAVLAARMLDLARLRAGERVLELACGAGGLGLAAAERVGPGGEVVVSDVVPEMTAIAAARADARGCTNVRALVLDLERIEQPDESYDAVLSREGLMFAVDPARASREIRRVLRPGGRFVVAVWGPRGRNPWLGVVLDAASAELGRPMPPPGVPGPFSLEDSARLAALLAEAGLSDVGVAELEVTTRASSFDEWWTRTCSLAGPLASVFASLPDGRLQDIRARARREAAAYETDGGFEFPGVTLLAAGRR